MLAGHFMQDMLPARRDAWGAPPQTQWRRVGQDGVADHPVGIVSHRDGVR